MKIIVAPIRTFAYGHALTMREWEALGRFAMSVERELSKVLTDSVIAESPARVQVPTIKDYAKPEIRRIMETEGLNPADWYFYIAPNFPECAPLPERITEWTLHMRLIGSVSTAKQAVTEDKHAPTLAEQFGKGH